MPDWYAFAPPHVLLLSDSVLANCQAKSNRLPCQEVEMTGFHLSPVLTMARWKAARKAKRKGLSIRGIARELGIHRDTVKKYMDAESPPMSRARATSAVS